MPVLTDDRVTKHRAAKLHIIVREDLCDVNLVVDDIMHDAAWQLWWRECRRRRWGLWWERR